jgi:hypothetical protein
MSRASKDILDFIVIGAQKAGTTSLFEYLRRHTELCLPSNKEAPYFSHDAMWTRGWDHYVKSTFGSADPTCRWGTVTTHYMVGGVYDASLTAAEVAASYDERTVPLRIRECVPNVRLIAILRDPVERARSHHQMTLMNGRERRPFEEAIDELLRPESLKLSRQYPKESTGYITWGEYGRILAGYFDVFPREQILVVFTDELERTPERFLQRVHEFLGVSPDVVPENLEKRYRESSSTRRFGWLSPDAVQRGVTRNRTTRALWHALPQGARHRMDRQFGHLAYRIDLWNQRGEANLDVSETTTVIRLREHFEQDSARLAELLGEIPPWCQSAGAV